MVVSGGKALSLGAISLALALPGAVACGASRAPEGNGKGRSAGGTSGGTGTAATAGTSGGGSSGGGGSGNRGGSGAKGGSAGMSPNQGGATSRGGDGPSGGSGGAGARETGTGGTDGTAGAGAPGACLTHDLDIPTANVSGVITVGGGVTAMSSGNVILSNGTDVVTLGTTSSGTYSVRTVPGTYDVVYVDKTLRTHTIRTGVTVAPRGTTFDIDIPSELTKPPSDSDDDPLVKVVGKLTVNGTPPPTPPTALAMFARRSDSRDSWERFANFAANSFAGEIAAGTYDLSYLRTDGMPDPTSWLPANDGFPVVLAGAVVPTNPVSDIAIDIDVPKADVVATVTINGEPPAGLSALIALTNPTLGSAVIIGASTSTTFRSQVIPGIYELTFASYPGNPDGPLNTGATLEKGVEVLPDGSTELTVDIGSVAVAGNITIDGAPVPSKTDYGTLYLGTDEGDEVPLATTTTGSYSTRVIPGRYDIYYEVGVPLEASAAPLNTRGKIASVVLAAGAPTMLDIDVRTVLATGTVTIDGVVVNKETDGGRLWLRTDYGDELPLGWTSNGTFSARVVPGTYEVHYEGTAPSSLAPFNEDATLGCLVVE
jgi:hypothetical protein